MEIAIMVVIGIIVVAFLLYVWLLRPLNGFKLNDQSYMYQRHDHLHLRKRIKKRKSIRPQNKQEKKNE